MKRNSVPLADFNTLCDLAEAKDVHVGLNAGPGVVRTARGDVFRPLVMLSAVTPTGQVLKHGIAGGDVDAAARVLFTRLGGRPGPA